LSSLFSKDVIGRFTYRGACLGSLMQINRHDGSIPLLLDDAPDSRLRNDPRGN
jgi:hypothetical protein